MTDILNFFSELDGIAWIAILVVPVNFVFLLISLKQLYLSPFIIFSKALYTSLRWINYLFGLINLIYCIIDARLRIDTEINRNNIKIYFILRLIFAMFRDILIGINAFMYISHNMKILVTVSSNSWNKKRRINQISKVSIILFISTTFSMYMLCISQNDYEYILYHILFRNTFLMIGAGICTYALCVVNTKHRDNINTIKSKYYHSIYGNKKNPINMNPTQPGVLRQLNVYIAGLIIVLLVSLFYYPTIINSLIHKHEYEFIHDIYTLPEGLIYTALSNVIYWIIHATLIHWIFLSHKTVLPNYDEISDTCSSNIKLYCFFCCYRHNYVLYIVDGKKNSIIDHNDRVRNNQMIRNYFNRNSNKPFNKIMNEDTSTKTNTETTTKNMAITSSSQKIPLKFKQNMSTSFNIMDKKSSSNMTIKDERKIYGKYSFTTDLKQNNEYSLTKPKLISHSTSNNNIGGHSNSVNRSNIEMSISGQQGHSLIDPLSINNDDINETSNEFQSRHNNITSKRRNSITKTDPFDLDQSMLYKHSTL